MNSDEARALEKSLKREEMRTSAEEQKRSRAAYLKTMNEPDEAQTKWLVDQILRDIEKVIRSRPPEPHKVTRSVFPIARGKRTLSWSGWKYDPILPKYAQDACDQLERLGYEVRVSIVNLGGGNIGPITPNGWIEVFW